MNKRKLIRKWAGTFYPDYNGYMMWRWRWPKSPDFRITTRGDGSKIADIDGVCIACARRIRSGETFWGVPPTCHACHTKRRGNCFVPKKYRYESDK